jgi:hypothetical protein
MAIGLGIASLLVAITSVVIALLARRDSAKSAVAAARSAEAAEATDRRSRTPQLDIKLRHPAPAPVDRVIYSVRNDGPQDLDDLVIYRPRPTDRITYPIAPTGRGDYADDEIYFGPVSLTQEVMFTLCCGASAELPEFRLRIECVAGEDSWTLTQLLPSPRLEEG